MQFSHSADMRPWKVLLVDDEKEICQDLEKHLRLLGYQVIVGHSRTEASYLMKHHRFDIAILDMMLPDGDGLQIFRDLKTKFPTIYTIMITGNASLENTIAALNEGVNAYLLKPFSLEAFKGALIQANNSLRLQEQIHQLIEENLKTRQFYENLLNSTSEAILVVNLDFEILYGNQTALSTLGIDRNNLAQQNLQHFIQDGFKVLNHIYQQLMMGKKVGGYRINLNSGSGKNVEMNLTADFLQNADGHVDGLIINLENTTLKNELFNRILRKEKISTIAHLAGALAHEIRNPINILSGRLQLLKQELEPRFDKSFDIIHRQIERIEGITEQLQKFNFTREDSIPELLPLGQFLKDYFQNYSRRYPHLQFEFNYSPESERALIEGNRVHFEDAFHYLFEAIPTISEKLQKIIFSLQIIKTFSTQPLLELSLHFQQYLPLEDVFEPFRLLANDDHNTSLGMAIMHTIFSNYGGKVLIDEGEKSILRLQFPLAEISPNMNGKKMMEGQKNK